MFIVTLSSIYNWSLKVKFVYTKKSDNKTHTCFVEIYSVSAETIISDAFSYSENVLYGSKVPVVTITVFKYRNKIGKIVVKAVPYSVT
jgi:hypothetical protein